MRRSFLLALLCPLLVATAAPAAKPERGREPLLTRWAAGVSKSAPRPEYPRPAWRRERWRSLNGRWSIRLGRERGRPILVPFPYQAPLSGIGRTRVHERVSYRKRLEVPSGWRRAGRRVLLHFGAVDWQATVRVNGRVLAVHRGGYEPFSVDVTDALAPGRRQALVVDVVDPVGPEADQPLGKQLARGRIYYTRSTGIWQSVWLEPVPHDRIAAGGVAGDLDGERLQVRATLRGRPDELRVGVRRAGRAVVERRIALAGSRSVDASVPVPSPDRWSPESPALYDVTLRLVRDGRVVDRVRTYAGFRTLRVRGGRFELNGEPYRLRGVLDQGYWPDGLYAAPTDAALRADVQAARAHGFNLARKHVKVEDPRWYYWADRLGLLVAQDMPSSRDLRSSGAQAQFTAEWEAMIGGLRDHPSVVMWVAFNENWGRPSAAFQSAVVDRARALDSTRPVVDASGSIRRANSDVVDHHDYGDDLARYDKVPPAGRARWIGEYGGVSLRIPGHVWREDPARAPRRPRTRAAMLRRFAFLTDQVTGATHLGGFVYTQLADVEKELNGLLTYDRLAKVRPERIAPIVARSPG